MLVVEVQRFLKVSSHVVCYSNFVQSYLSSLIVIKQFCAKVKPLQKLNRLAVFLLFFIYHRHNVGHMCFILDVAHLNAIFGFHLNVGYIFESSANC